MPICARTPALPPLTSLLVANSLFYGHGLSRVVWKSGGSRARVDRREAAESPEPGPRRPQRRGGKLRLKNRGLKPAPGQQATPRPGRVGKAGAAPPPT